MSSIYATLIALTSFVEDRVRRDEKGATAVEYGLLVGLIAVAIIVAVTFLGDSLTGLFNNIGNALP
ncbi:pilus assembly protein [Geodermatophilus sp. Leaf369]|uniref:Flp family type IVb pilin n=1 Tax=Geodermatophilus sp. Leaf369 TaxID=1736354 RepID=UPI0006FD7CB4|nr:Flp family type IVb pilin [Geodermatophilus sp. Leaf369]KQS59830.1 pilus assembly protein [Geodermatophilus sp. Leaf369]